MLQLQSATLTCVLQANKVQEMQKALQHTIQYVEKKEEEKHHNRSEPVYARNVMVAKDMIWVENVVLAAVPNPNWALSLYQVTYAYADIACRYPHA